MDGRALGAAGVPQCLGDRKISVVQLGVLADQADGDLLVGMLEPLDHGRPFGEIGRGDVEPQLAADDAGKVGLLQHERRFIEAGDGAVFDNAVGLDVAEQRDLVENALFGDGLVAAQHDDVGGDAHSLQLLDRVLGGLGFVLVGAVQVGHQRDMDKQAVLPARLVRDLAHSLDKGLTFDIADGAADFGDDDIGFGLAADTVDKFLDFVGDMGDDLNR